MKYFVCPTCGKVLGDIEIDYDQKSNEIMMSNMSEKEKIVKAKITIKDKEILIETSFEVPLDDHNIKIPKVVNQKIASIIMVDVKATLKPKV